MFLVNQAKSQIDEYKKMLSAIASLSNLSSDSSIPYLGYRSVENIFCKAFNAENLSRSDCSVDAKKNYIGVGIKTFLHSNGRTLQKIAEFNSDTELYKGKSPKELIQTISFLRNERLKTTKRIYNLNQLFYHCVTRDDSKIILFECAMEEICINKIKNIKVNKNVISFEDSKNEYSFNISKSTLYKRFLSEDILAEIKVDIIEDPYCLILDLMGKNLVNTIKFSPIRHQSHIFLPLFSDKGGRSVPERSGLNQWNAKGRPRDFNEVYIPIPSWIHKTYSDFFPPRDTSFKLKLPNGSTIIAKLCQDGSKALMSNPNSDLGKWLLREVMNLQEGELLTYKKLQEIGLDSVVIYKESEDSFLIDFTEIGSYDMFVIDSKG